jgi:5'-nucleotidase
MVEFFKNNPEFYRVLAQADTPFSTYDELGCLMCDAMMAETGADVAFVNAGGIRYEEHPAGDFTVDDVLRLDPFGNTAVEFELTGEELRQMLMACHQADDNQFPCVAGVKCKLKTVGGDARKLKDVALFTPDGKKLNLKKSYRVVTNSYAAVVSDSPKKDPGRDLNRQTSDMIMRYLEKQGHVSYQGVSRVEKE